VHCPRPDAFLPGSKGDPNLRGSAGEIGPLGRIPGDREHTTDPPIDPAVPSQSATGLLLRRDICHRAGTAAVAGACSWVWTFGNFRL
jgi:hypothetical protein